MGATGQITAALTAVLSGGLYGAFGPATLFGLAAAGMLLLLVAGLYQGRALLDASG